MILRVSDMYSKIYVSSTMTYPDQILHQMVILINFNWKILIKQIPIL